MKLLLNQAIECVIDTPASEVKGIALVCHPHPLQGGTMDNKVVTTLAKACLDVGYVTARFNFRGVGQSTGEFDHGIAETEDAATVLAHLQSEHPNRPLSLAGFSFGSYVCTALAQRVAVSNLILVGSAVARFGKGETAFTLPSKTLIIHGHDDDVVPHSEAVKWAGEQSKYLITVPNCGHFFHGQLPALRRLVSTYLESPNALV